MADPLGAVHLPISDYVRDIESGAILPLPVQYEVMEEAQKEQYLRKKVEDKEKEDEELEQMKKETEEDAYDPVAAEKEVCYEGIPWRSDFQIWFGEGGEDAAGEWDPPDADTCPNSKIDKTRKAISKKSAKAAKSVAAVQEPVEQPVQDNKTAKGGKSNQKQGASKRVKGQLGATMKLRQFEWGMIQRDFTVVAFGRRRSGKSFFMRDVLYHLRRQFPRGMCITRTAINGFVSLIVVTCWY